MKNMTMLSFGGDPEVHLFDKKLGRIVSAIPVLKCDKHNPVDLGEGYKCYADNVLVEFTIPVSYSPFSFMNNVLRGVELIRKHLEKIEPDRYDLRCVAAYEYANEDLHDEKGNKLEQAWKIGCDPTFDAYARAMNPIREFDSNLRTGSFHVHVGHPDLIAIEAKERMIHLMDAFVGCPFVLADNDPSTLKRRQYYGRAGEFRVTDYGVEYRVLSNFCMRKASHIESIGKLTNAAFSVLKFHGNESILKGLSNEIQKAINTGDRSSAEKVIKEVGVPISFVNDILAG